MKKSFLIFIVFTVFSFVLNSKVIPFEKISKVDSILVTKDYIYVVEGTSVNIFNRKDFKFVKKFGKKGKGPGEFSSAVKLSPNKDKLVAFDFMKILVFSKNGDYISEKRKKKITTFKLKSVGDNYIGIYLNMGKKSVKTIFALFDPDLNILKEIKSINDKRKASRKIYMFKDPLRYTTIKDRIFLNDTRGFNIKIFDKAGNLIRTIEQKYEFLKLTDKTKKEIIESFKGPDYEYFKKNVVFPDYFSSISNLYADNNYLYVFTYKTDNKGTETFIYDLDGNFIKKTSVDIKYADILEKFPMCIYDGVLYQFVDNEDDEIWELHVNKII